MPADRYVSQVEIAELEDYAFDWRLSRGSIFVQDMADGRSGQIRTPAPGDYVLRYVIRHPTAGSHVIVAQPLRVRAGAAAGAGPEAAGATGGRSGTVEPGIDRPGLDLAQTVLESADPLACQALCAADPDCRAWTYVNPGVQGEPAICWTKFDVPEGFESDCCTSGVMDRAAAPVPDAPGTAAGAVPAGSQPAEAPGTDAPAGAAPALPDRSSLRPEAGSALAHLCPAGGAPCAIADPGTGLQVTLAPGFGITEPFFYETPGGARAGRASFDLVRLDDGATVVRVNPRQADPAACLDAGDDQFCLAEAPGPDEQTALVLLLGSLAANPPATAPEVEAMGEDDLAGVWTLRIQADGHPRQDQVLAVVELAQTEASGSLRGSFRSAPDYAGFAGLTGAARIGFEADGRLRLDLLADTGAALVMLAEPFGPWDWLGEVGPPGPRGPAPVGAAFSRVVAPGEDWQGAPWMRGEPDGMAAAMEMARGALTGALAEASPGDRAAIGMIGELAGALSGALGAQAAPAAPPSAQMRALGGVLMEGIDADEALILMAPHLEVTR